MREPMEAEQGQSTSTLEVFPAEPLLKRFCEGNASYRDFTTSWKKIVPKILCPTPEASTLEYFNKDDSVNSCLLKPLEDFICNFEHIDFNNYLSSINDSPAVCGKLFKIGEPTYNCRQCAMDSTCVLCVECFVNSGHKNHKYKMRTSAGGGCCDCGDLEAWKNDPSCNAHKLTLQDSKSQLIPDSYLERARFVMRSILQYAFQFLTIDNISVPIEADVSCDANSDTAWDNHCTVLYNDEVHTFEQVINTLYRVIKCTQRDAIEYVTYIDREGRAIVKCSTFKECNDLRAEIERYTSRHGTKPLKVLVIQAQMIAHQVFAMKLLSWLQSVLKLSMRLRALFAEVLTNKDGDTSFLEGIMVRDSFLWKSARLYWHRLLITGMLMDCENKQIFATTFTKNYGLIFRDFIDDDHEHSFSIASLSVQIFTVPTLAHYLIEQHDALFIIMNAFLLECQKKTNSDGKLEFDRNVSNTKFKRAIFSLYDIRYLLSFIPTEFSEAIRSKFSLGFTLVVNLLTQMQGMDSVRRQLGQHMEYEPEWESAFNLHLKLAPIVTVLLKWCTSDKLLLVKSFRAVATKLHEDHNSGMSPFQTEVSINNFTCYAFLYDVATLPVSIHLPLSRFLAGLTVGVEKFGLKFSELIPYPAEPEELIEPVLRTRVMIAQVHAGMWRRNGYSLTNQIYFYNNVKCRGEMLDKDIILLQMGASLMPSQQFMLTILYKFNLAAWAKPDFDKVSIKTSEDDGNRQVIHLVEEFLLLLITVIGERFIPGVGQVTEADCLKREIMQQLCIKPLSHSELDKTLPDDNNHETGMEDVIDEVAVFKRPSQGSSVGVYELKPELAAQYNVFFYHYTREELSKSEENQRKYNKSAIGLECCPPPKLPPFTDIFKPVVGLLTSDIMIYIMKLVLERGLNFCARSFSEPQVHKVLHLIGYALQEEEAGQLNESFVQKTCNKDTDFPQILEKLLNNPRIEAHKDLIKWTLQKYLVLSKDCVESTKVLPMECSNAEKEERENRSKLAAERKAKIMAQMAVMQKNFMKDNAHFFEEDMVTSENVESASEAIAECEQARISLGPNQTQVPIQFKSYICILCQEEQEVTAGGKALVFAAFIQLSTVLSRDRTVEGPKSKKEPGYVKFLCPAVGPGPHTSTCGHVMHRQCWRRYYESVIIKENRRPYRLRQPSSFDVEKQEYLCPLCECLSNTVIPILPMMSSLPNLNHDETLKQTSFTEWTEASLEAISRSRNSEGLASYKGNLGPKNSSSDNKKSGTNNEVIVISSDEEEESSSTFAVETSNTSSDDLESLEEVAPPPNQTTDSASNVVPSNPVLMRYMLNVLPNSISGALSSSNSSEVASSQKEPPVEPCFSSDITDMVLLYAQNTYTKGFGEYLEDKLAPLTVWQSCAYTIHTLEQFLRVNNKPLFGGMSSRQRDCLQALVRVSGVLGAAWKESAEINRQGSEILEMVLHVKKNSPSILYWDCFSVLVTLTSSVPSMFHTSPVPVPTGTSLELNIFLLTFYCMIAQILNSVDSTQYGEPVAQDPETECLAKYQMSNFCPNLNTQAIWEHIKEESLPFLRCAALYFSFLSDVPPPEEMTKPGGDNFENLCAYLGVPSSCSKLLDNRGFSELLVKWVFNIFKMDKSVLHQKSRIFKKLRATNSLVSLPEDYSDLINTVSLFTCPNSDREDSRNPTMCLVCGEMLCSQTYCCQMELNKALVGACNYHAYLCGAGVGIFLRIRECEVLLLATPNRGTFVSPPYLDEYGEPDPGLNRGNPLRLCHERYKRLQMMWLSHSIYEEIARSIEATNSPLNTQWQHL